MKRYISAILIPCLLLQLSGCYSSEYIYKDEIDAYYPEEVITIKTIDKKEFVIKKDVALNDIEDNSTITFCSEYEIDNDTLYLLRKGVVFSNQINSNGINARRVATDTVAIPSHLVTSISRQKFNWWTTCLLIVSIIVIVVFASTFEYGGSNNTTTLDTGWY